MENSLRANGYLIVPGKNNLFGAHLEDQDLRWLDLRGSDMRLANLRCSDLTGANLDGVDLEGAHLLGANLFLAKVTLPKGWYLVDGYAFYHRQEDGWKSTSTRHETTRSILVHEISKIRYSQQVNRSREAKRIEEMLNPTSEENEDE